MKQDGWTAGGAEAPGGAPLVRDAPGVAAVVTSLAGAALCAFDLEFVSAERLVPALCLVQVAWVPAAAPGAVGEGAAPLVAVIDALAVDTGPVFAALAAHAAVIAHAPRQDLGLVATLFDLELPGVLDLQLMAAFAGLGDQLGLGALAGEVLGVRLDKELQWTDWSRRPLSAAHLAYAAADVLHLPALHHQLASRLGPRLAWAREESALVAREAARAARVTPAEAWRELGLRGLDPGARRVAGALAAWRLETARAANRPLGHVLADRALLDLARELARARGPVAAALRGARVASELARRHADALAERIAAAPPLADDAAGGAPTSPRALRWAEGLLAIAHLLAEEHGIAARLLGTRADAEAFARAVDGGGLEAAAAHPALATWRRELLGEAWLAWLGGRRSLVADVGSSRGLRLV